MNGPILKSATGIMREASLSVLVSSSGHLASPSSESREGFVAGGAPHALDSQEIKVYRPARSPSDVACWQNAMGFEVSPQSDLVSLFTAKYTYHNLQGLSKHEARQSSWGAVLSITLILVCSSIWWRPFSANLYGGRNCCDLAEFKTIGTCGFSEIGMDLAYLNT